MEKLKLGIIYRDRDPGAFVSVDRVGRETLKVLTERFPTVIFYPNRYRHLSAKELEKVSREFVDKVDIVFKLPPNTDGTFIERERPVPLIFYALGSMPRGGISVLRVLEKLRPIDSIIFSSRADERIFNRVFGNSAMKGYIVPFGIDCNTFRPASPEGKKQIKQRLGIPYNSPLLLYAGRINVQKNIHTLLKIFQQVAREHKKSRLCLAGEEDDAALGEFNVTNEGYGEYLTELIDKYHIKDQVIMPGKLGEQDLIPLYSAADIFVNCTVHHDENFGFSQVEAMACGTPVVCSKWGGLKDTVIHGRTGFHMETLLTDNGIKVDWRSGVKYILHLLDSPSLLREMSESCVEYARQHYSLEHFAENLEKVVISTFERRERLAKEESFKIHPKAVKFWREYVKRQIDPRLGHFKPLFSEENYELYKFFIEPYASCTTDNIHLDRTSIPYFSTEVKLNERAKILEVQDPIWPQSYELRDREFRVFSEINGKRDISAIYRNVKQRVAEIDYGEVEELFREFCRKGAVLV